MIPLPGALGGAELIGWRLDHQRHARHWDSGEGPFLLGGRWNSPGTRVTYSSLDAATTILEVAVHIGFAALDVTPRILTSFVLVQPGDVHIVQPEDLPEPNWLQPGEVSVAQQRFGDALLAEHAFVAIPSVVSSNSWNLLISVSRAAGLYRLHAQERFALDPRLKRQAG